MKFAGIDMRKEKKTLKPKTGIVCDINSTANKLVRQYKLTTKLKHSSGKTAMITFKDMTLTVMENNGKTNKTVESSKYLLCDMALWKYCAAVKRYVAKGYISEGSVSNIDTIRKSEKKNHRIESVKNADR